MNLWRRFEREIKAIVNEVDIVKDANWCNKIQGVQSLLELRDQLL